MKKFISLCFVLLISTFLTNAIYAQHSSPNEGEIINTSGFNDSAHHWRDITDSEQVFLPLPNQKRYNSSQVSAIANNILLYQQKNGGWPKNYDMLAILTKQQKEILKEDRDSLNTTFDNGTTYTQVDYLARAYSIIKDDKYKNAAIKGIDFMLKAQYPNGGWPQFYPDTSGYRKYITFNDDAMTGVMSVLLEIKQHKPYFSFVSEPLRQRANIAFQKGVDCILKCQIKENGKLTVWCQQHDEVNFTPRGARTFELPGKCSEESADIVLLLMKIKNPDSQIINSIKNAVNWFKESEIKNIKIEIIPAPKVVYKYHKSSFDRIVVEDSTAQPIWARFYELGTNKPFFANRDSKKVYKLSDVDRERRTGYSWYDYAPQKVLNVYPEWLVGISEKSEGRND
jgi:PelA/Pel-15E family pectate lyase